MARKGKASAVPTKDNDVRLNVAPEGSAGPSAEGPTPEGKSIFLFADGTGNSSAKLFKTNVWRMYEAVDLGLASPGKHVQIAYYDNGVGTSSVRPLRLLGGIFGIGLKANVLRLYAFLCRNYQPNDRIYVFGFSRGAFTIRLLVGLICSQGIIKTSEEATLAFQIRDAYRAFCADHWPNQPIARFFARIFRSIRKALLTAKRRLFGPKCSDETKRLHTDIEFVGVWDTVAAYGGPFAEFTRGIDDWIWPLTMPNYGLSPKVRKARHALALDDERDAFHPLLWDEYREQLLIEKGGPVVVAHDSDGKPVKLVRKVADGRLKQVWFTGVHSDVGGGYPDESLSYISLLWMMDELSPDANAPEVDFIDSFVQRAKDLANPYGPIHDSRSGLGAYYRYQPRKIAALLHPPHYRTKSLRDPEISRGFDEEHGLLTKVQVHESVLARIISGIDDYAPAALPAGFDVVTATGPHARALLRAQDHAVLAAARPSEPLRVQHQENGWDTVWRRRIAYFLTVGATLVLLTLPFHKLLDDVEALCSDDRCFARELVEPALLVLPQSLRDFLAQWLEKPLLLILLLLLVGLLIGVGQRLEGRFRDRVRRTWNAYLAGSLEARQPSKLRRLRESLAYQHTLYLLKWRILPAFFGLATLVALFYAIIVLTTQTLYAIVEPRQTFCTSRDDAEGRPSVRALPFETKARCTDLKVNVEGARKYAISLEVTSDWKDDTLRADPSHGIINPPGYLKGAAPFKRVTSANWLAPLSEVRTPRADHWFPRLAQPIFGPQVHIRKLALNRVGSTNLYTGTLCARRDGHLYMMVNDAAPLLMGTFYANNRGAALVSVTPVEGDVGKCDPRE